MLKNGSYVGIILTIVLACPVIAVLIFYERDHVPDVGVLSIQPVSALSLPWPAGRFEEFGHACGGRNNSYVTGYRAYDGTRLARRGMSFSSESEAGSELRKFLRYASRIAETGPKYNERGIVIGERVIAFFAVDDKEAVSIIWTEGKSLYAIEAFSLETALEFEKDDSTK
jgi:hypothetical protein